MNFFRASISFPCFPD